MITLKNITKVYQSSVNQVVALNDVSLVCEPQGFISIVGPSGCGKTTLLNIIGGLDNEYQGQIFINDQLVKHYRSREMDCYRNRHIGFVFQSYNLIMHLSIYRNIEMALSLSKISVAEKKRKIEEVCRQVGIIDQLYKKPATLSGGQLQRAAIARALVNDPSIILADEPTGALDTKSSVQVMNVLKEIAKTRLVVLVTHNEKLANDYSDRLLTMLDGAIIHDEKRNVYSQNKETVNYPKIKTNMALKSSLGLSIINLYTKKVRSLLTVLACSIGIIGLSIVLTVVNGMSLYMTDMQKQALSTYPVSITSTVDNEEPIKEKIDYDLYPDNDLIHIVDYDPVYEGHVNVFSNEFLNHVRTMPENLYSAIGYTGWLKMHILSQYNNTYRYLTSYVYMKEINYKYHYLEEEYDLLSGSKMPTEKEEVAIVIDQYNCINRSVLNSLGIYSGDQDNFKFADLLNKEYRVISNDDYYYYNNGHYAIYPTTIAKCAQVYDRALVNLKVTAILRQKPTAKTKLYGTTLLYTSALTDYVFASNWNSQIVQTQMKNLDLDVFTGLEYQELLDSKGNVIQTIDYQREYNLGLMGATFSITRILIYTNKFENFSLIENYISIYNDGKTKTAQIRYNDYLKNMTSEFELFMKILTTVLVIFASISLAVAALMIVIITYVSVLERTKEIGILRSIGVRKFDVGCVFLFENGVIGFLAGLLGITLGAVLLNPILNVVIQALENSNMLSFDFQSLNFGNYNILYIFLLVLGSIILCVIAGLVPSIIAAYKSPVKALRHE